MNNEIIRQYEDKNIIIYKRINRPHKGIKLYFLAYKEANSNFDAFKEFANISQVKLFIKKLK